MTWHSIMIYYYSFKYYTTTRGSTGTSRCPRAERNIRVLCFSLRPRPEEEDSINGDDEFLSIGYKFATLVSISVRRCNS